MLKFKDVVMANKTYACYEVNNILSVDQIALHVLRQDCPDFILPIKTMNIDGVLEIQCDLSEGVRLKYSSNRVYKNELVAILNNMITAFQTCNDWFLDYHYFCFNFDYIMIKHEGTAISFPYIPVEENYSSEKEIKEFLEDFVTRYEILDDERFGFNLIKVLKNSPNVISGLSNYLISVGKNSTNEKDASAGKNFGIMNEPKNNYYSYNDNQKNTFESSQVQRDYGYSNENVIKPVKEDENQINDDITASDSKNSKFGLGFGQKKEKNQQKQDENNILESTSSYRGKEYGADTTAESLRASLFGEIEETPSKTKSNGKFFNSSKSNKKDTKDDKKEYQKETARSGFSLFGKKNKADKAADIQNAADDTGRGRRIADDVLRNDGYNGNGNNLSGEYNRERRYVIGDDVTDIDEEAATTEDNYDKLSLQLVESSGYNIPAHVELDLSSGNCTVGRAVSSGVNIADYCFDSNIKFMARRQFMLQKKNNSWYIMDISNHGTTYINNQQIAPNALIPLEIGDLIMVKNQPMQRIVYRVV